MFAGDIFSFKLKRVHDLTCLWFLEQEPIKINPLPPRADCAAYRALTIRFVGRPSSAGRMPPRSTKIFRRLA